MLDSLFGVLKLVLFESLEHCEILKEPLEKKNDYGVQFSVLLVTLTQKSLFALVTVQTRALHGTRFLPHSRPAPVPHRPLQC